MPFIDTGEDGTWLAVFPFLHFPITEYAARLDPAPRARRSADPVAAAGLSVFTLSHTASNSTEREHDRA